MSGHGQDQAQFKAVHRVESKSGPEEWTELNLTVSGFVILKNGDEVNIEKNNW